jgi:NAD(P)-dependent dehydrogenase (short-subunit alcohol dehydrogenase family)
MEVDDRHLDQVRTFILAAADLPWKLAGIINCSESLLLRPQGAAPTGLRGEEDEDQLVAAHLAAAFATVRGAGEALKGGGRLILVTAVSPDPLPDRPAYRAAGSNLAALLRSAQDIYGPRGVRIEAVSPSANGTDIAHLIGASWVAEIVERLALPSATPTPEPVSAPEASPEHDPRVVDPAGDLEFEARSSRGSAWRV